MKTRKEILPREHLIVAIIYLFFAVLITVTATVVFFRGTAATWVLYLLGIYLYFQCAKDFQNYYKKKGDKRVR
jgi:fatty acid desaturase